LTAIAVTASGQFIPRDAFAQQNTAKAGLLNSDVCLVTPEVTEGPFYFDPKLVRSNIAEGKQGVPIVLLLQIVDEHCEPLNGARVDIWHCDATGVYSNYPGQGDDPQHPISTEGQSYLRGTQLADQQGVVRFQSIYPGWYPGRTPHIHFKVFIDSKNVLTGQIFFLDALSEYIYQNVPPYSSRKQPRDTLNIDDSIATEATRASYANVREETGHYLVSMIIGANPNSLSRYAEGRGRPQGLPPAGGPRPFANKDRTSQDRLNAIVPGTKAHLE
jgi:protocatechuate 3,4-dioxygenase beta subunit